MAILHVCLTLLVIQGAFGATIADVEKALHELDDLSLKIQGELHKTMDNQSAVLHDIVYNFEVSASREIKNEIASASSRIKTLFENVETVVEDVSQCRAVSEKDLLTFGEALEKKLKECGDHLIMTGNGMLYSTWSKVLYDYDIHYNCNKMALWQCKTYENVACADRVLSYVEWAKQRIGDTTQVVTVEMINRVTGLNYPCGDMAVQEMKHYSSLILKYVTSCLKNLSDIAFRPKC